MKTLTFMAFVVLATNFGSHASAKQFTHSVGFKGIQIVSFSPNPGVKYDVSIVPPKLALSRIVEALKAIYQDSPFNREVIEALKKKRRLVIIYDPDFYKEELGSIMAASFRPGAPEIAAMSDGRKQLVATVTRHGIKWPTRELAAVLVHELIGHGQQYLKGWLNELRELDYECEAFLRSEKAFQDFKLNKRSLEMVLLRKNMEYYCDDFIKFTKTGNSAQKKLWDVLNQNVPALLKIFDRYVDAMRRNGTLLKSAGAIAKLTGDELRRVFETGQPEAQYTVADYILSRSDAPQDRERALKWLLRSAKQGFADAQFRVGTFFLKGGRSSEANGKLALRWYKEAARRGHLKAQEAIGYILEKGYKIAKKAPEEAAKWYKIAAKRGHVGAQYRLGIMHEKGLGLAKDHRRAVKWYQMAAERGHPLAQSALGYAYEKGRGVPKDLSKAMHWYLKGAEQGYAKPQFNVGVMYAKGRSVKRDDRRAVQWLKKAATQGYTRAQRVLGIMFEQGRGTKSDPAKALLWYRKAAKQGDKKAAKLAASVSRKVPSSQ